LTKGLLSARSFIESAKISMADKLIDTNILVYAYDTTEGEKHKVSREILRRVWIEGGGIVCLQNLMEFFVVITRRVENPVDVTTARAILYDFSSSDRWKIIDRDTDTLFKAIDIVAQYGVHFWDAVIAATMSENGIAEIVTENKKDFDKIPGLEVLCPF